MDTQVDYIIVGCGLAGMAFAEKLTNLGKTFLVFDNASQNSSLVAAGLYNPVILKRFTPVWQSEAQLKHIPFYNTLEANLGITIDFKAQILRRFSSVEEQNLWFTAADKPNLEAYMALQLVENTNPNIKAHYKFGEILHGGRVDTKTLLEEYKASLKQKQVFISDDFDYNSISFLTSGVSYEQITAKHIVFAEGFGMQHNPFFNTLPLQGTKGEVLTIYAPKLQLTPIIKSSVFIIPIGNHMYKVGSTYNNFDKTPAPTQSAKQQLLTKLKTFLKCDFEVVAHLAGIRPSVKDRRPLVGQHPKYKQLFLLNGMGSRGVMIAPFIAHQLVNYIEHNVALDADINMTRFL